MENIANFILTIRSSLFFIGYALITVVVSVSGLLFTSFLPFHIRGRYFVLGNALIIYWLRICCGVKTQVKGTLPKDTPYVAMAKHQSQWETFYLQWYLFPVATVVKRELFNIPFFGWALRMMNAIGIDRSNPRAAIRQTMEQGLSRLRNNYSLLIFPEGTRTPVGKRGKYARSGAGIAIEAGVAVLPIAHNGGKLWPAKGLKIKPGTITLVIGDPIPTSNRESRELMLEVENWIEAQCELL
ncbi:1-acyl-sn-glycerol-3-phosphate acyltransferase [Zhongshania aliphaticivorans]|uniref:1-acyl-sn-glycerol-3-phosphate acyltransferase n=1 Tax=Zhongshania aliphaticivorans TaxID=1470434 RepID=A0A5S9PL18_9GAMM|nr:lysophospholipid acyltransferase family protein [Zhongshania aliphaticivorans]CAA0104455.1 1-acyl-sn-glycerol-3-phosphate acyltransferase [Zhongshania aliphaticivorans]CAA0104706.1 1-acyl-sn-glycerol-3-phosphate acyltransferase [Zhongshania aliphaticivorans]